MQANLRLAIRVEFYRWNGVWYSRPESPGALHIPDISRDDRHAHPSRENQQNIPRKPL